MDDNRNHVLIKEFWGKMPPTLDSMTFTSNQTSLMEEDKGRILEYLPSCKGKRVLELAAGIGRYTGHLAEEALHVTSVDYIQKYIDINEEENQRYGNISFLCADVTELDFPDGSFDLVFSAYLLSNMAGDEAVKTMVERSLKWLSPEGYIFFRESCPFTKSAIHEGIGVVIQADEVNSECVFPYRSPTDYCHLLWNAGYKETCLRHVRMRNSQAHTKLKDSPLNCTFMAQRVPSEDANCLMSLANEMHTFSLLTKMEWVSGDSWLTQGGEGNAKRLISEAGVSCGDRVLVIGCGTGGTTFHLTKEYSAWVHGVDLSTNSICFAMEKLSNTELKYREKIQFEAADISKLEFQHSFYDVIYSCDSLSCFQDKKAIFTKFERWLKPGGKLLIADYCQDKISCPREFQQLLNSFGKNQLSMEDYEGLLKDVGFSDISAKDDSETFINFMQDEMAAIIAKEETFVERFSPGDFMDLNKWASTKIHWLKSKQLSWGIYKAKKRFQSTTSADLKSQQKN